MKNFLALIILLHGMVFSQINHFVIEKGPEKFPLVQKHPDKAYVLISSYIEGLRFTPYEQLIELIAKPDRGEYLLVVPANRKQKVSVRAPGFMESSFLISAELGVKQTQSVVISPKDASALKGKGSFILKTVPANAQIQIDGLPTFNENTPYEFSNWRTGKYRALLTLDNYKPKEVEFTIQKDQKGELSVQMESSLGALVINSTPSGANVLIDGQHVGKTPWYLDPAKHAEIVKNNRFALRIEKDGYYPWEEYLDRRQDKRNFREIKLLPELGFHDDGAAVDLDYLQNASLETPQEAQQRINLLEKAIQKYFQSRAQALNDFEKNFPALAVRGEFEETEEFQQRQQRWLENLQKGQQKAVASWDDRIVKAQEALKQMHQKFASILNQEHLISLPLSAMELGSYDIEKHAFPVRISLDDERLGFRMVEAWLLMETQVAKQFKKQPQGQLQLAYILKENGTDMLNVKGINLNYKDVEHPIYPKSSVPWNEFLQAANPANASLTIDFNLPVRIGSEIGTAAEKQSRFQIVDITPNQEIKIHARANALIDTILVFSGFGFNSQNHQKVQFEYGELSVFPEGGDLLQSIKINGGEVLATNKPVHKAILAPGEYELEVLAYNCQPYRTKITIKNDEHLQVTPELKLTPKAQKYVDDQANAGKRKQFWTLMLSGVAAAGIGTLFHSMANGFEEDRDEYSKEYDAAETNFAPIKSNYNEAHDNMVAARTTRNVFWSVGAALIGAAVIRINF